jgi:hypothetical protein
MTITSMKRLTDLRANFDTVQRILERIDRSFSNQGSKFNVGIEIPNICKANHHFPYLSRIAHSPRHCAQSRSTRLAKPIESCVSIRPPWYPRIPVRIRHISALPSPTRPYFISILPYPTDRNCFTAAFTLPRTVRYRIRTMPCP